MVYFEAFAVKRVRPITRSSERRRRTIALSTAALAFVVALAYLAYALLASLRMIVRPGSDVARPNLILMALAALVVGLGIAMLRRLAFVVVANRRRGPWSG